MKKKWKRGCEPALADPSSRRPGDRRRSRRRTATIGVFGFATVQSVRNALADIKRARTLFGTAAASRREPTGELGAAALVRFASEARAAADDQLTWQLQSAATPPHVSSAAATPLLTGLQIAVTVVLSDSVTPSPHALPPLRTARPRTPRGLQKPSVTSPHAAPPRARRPRLTQRTGPPSVAVVLGWARPPRTSLT